MTTYTGRSNGAETFILDIPLFAGWGSLVLGVATLLLVLIRNIYRRRIAAREALARFAFVFLATPIAAGIVIGFAVAIMFIMRSLLNPI